MASILAIEADPQRGRLLARLIQEHVKADITIVESVKAAIPAIAKQPPDLILAPTLLSPQDSEELTAHVKQLHAAPYVQMLTIAALDMLVEAPREERGGLGIFKRRPATLDLRYDPRMMAAQIADGLDRARAARAERATALAHAEWCAAAVQPDDETARALVARGKAFSGQQNDERRCARRNTPGDVPWLSAVRLASGLDLHLVNISSRGLLVESVSKLAPGNTYELHLNGPSTHLIVKARFVRSEVARVDSLGVSYYAAAEFEKQLDLLVRGKEPARGSNPQQALGALLATVLSEPGHREPAQIRFARGLCKLVRARDVLVRNVPIAPADGSESIYFHVKGEGPSRAILQVMFERDREITASEFRLLKAGASLTAAVLELEKPLAEKPVMLSERVAEVA